MATQSRSMTIETPARQEFFDVTPDFEQFIEASGIADGIAVAFTQHTSCCILLQDTLNVLAKIAPPTRNEGQYLHPGPIHIRNAAELRGEHPSWGLNTDGHIISSILGRSEVVPVAAGRALLGEFGRVYFGDLDSVRARTRTVIFQLIGT